MSILTDALRILGRFFGLRPGPNVEKLPEPKFKVGDRVWVESAQQYGTIERVHEAPKDKPKHDGKPS